MTDACATCECAVIGLGAMGSSALYHLARRGTSVIGLEQYETGHERGSSHGRSRVFRTTYDDPLYVEMARESLKMWRDLERVTDCDVLDLTGLLVFASRENSRFSRTLRTLAEAGLPHEVWDGPQAAREFPTFHFDDRIAAFHATENGVLKTDTALRQMRTTAVQDGARIWQGCRVEEVIPQGTGVRIVTRAGLIDAARVVVTAGPWLAKLLPDLRLPLEVTREQKVYFQVRGPERFHPARFPVFCEYDTANYGFPSLDGDTMKVAADHQGAVVDPDAVDRDADAEYPGQMADWMDRWQPGVVRQAVNATVCLYTNTPDRDFLIDQHPVHEQIVIGGGFSGHGMKFSILVGKWLADLALGETLSCPSPRFRIQRFGNAEQPTP